MLNKSKYRNKSIRLKNYDYTQKGSYFITICTKNRECLFGYIDNGIMILNDAGKMLGKWYFEMENKYPNIRCDTYISMPNHFHCIIEIMGNRVVNNNNPDAHDRKRIPYPKKRLIDNNSYGPNNKKYNATIPQMIDWFKTMTTNEYIRGVKKYNWSRYDRKLWQHNYYDHIVRTENDLTRIRNYIKYNPSNWNTKKRHTKDL